jgi:hypothetical protein
MNITVKVKNVYGQDRIYPICSKAKLFTRLTNTKTLSTWDINKIKELVYTVNVKPITL